MEQTIRVFVSGVIVIGVITALFMPGRQTAKGITAIGNASSKLLGTAIKG